MHSDPLHASPPADDCGALTPQIDALIEATIAVQHACSARDFHTFTLLYAQQEEQMVALRIRIQQDVSLLNESCKQKLRQILSLREQTQQSLRAWLAAMKGEMQTVRQNSRLLKTYT